MSIQVLPTNYGKGFGVYVTETIEGRTYSAVAESQDYANWIDRTEFRDFNRPLFTLTEDQVNLIKSAMKEKPTGRMPFLINSQE